MRESQAAAMEKGMSVSRGFVSAHAEKPLAWDFKARASGPCIPWRGNIWSHEKMPNHRFASLAIQRGAKMSFRNLGQLLRFSPEMNRAVEMRGGFTSLESQCRGGGLELVKRAKRFGAG